MCMCDQVSLSVCVCVSKCTCLLSACVCVRDVWGFTMGWHSHHTVYPMIGVKKKKEVCSSSSKH